MVLIISATCSYFRWLLPILPHPLVAATDNNNGYLLFALATYCSRQYNQLALRNSMITTIAAPTARMTYLPSPNQVQLHPEVNKQYPTMGHFLFGCSSPRKRVLGSTKQRHVKCMAYVINASCLTTQTAASNQKWVVRFTPETKHRTQHKTLRNANQPGFQTSNKVIRIMMKGSFRT